MCRPCGCGRMPTRCKSSLSASQQTPMFSCLIFLGFKQFLAHFEAVSLTLEGGTKFSQKSPSATTQWFERAKVAYERPLGRMKIKGSHQWYAVPSGDFAYQQTSVDLSLPLLPWQVHPSLTASHFKFQGDNYPFGVPRKETTKKLRLSKF